MMNYAFIISVSVSPPCQATLPYKVSSTFFLLRIERCPWCHGSKRIAPGVSCGPCGERGYGYRYSTLSTEKWSSRSREHIVILLIIHHKVLLIKWRSEDRHCTQIELTLARSASVK
jgi:hypothetical protein